MFGLSPWELILILAVAFLFFGAKKLPEIGRALGQAKKEFTAAKKRAQSEAKEPADDQDGLPEVLKDQLFSRLPGVGKINRLKKTIHKADKVAKMFDGQSKPKS